MAVLTLVLMLAAMEAEMHQQAPLAEADSPVVLEDVEVVGRRGRALVDPQAVAAEFPF